MAPQILQIQLSNRLHTFVHPCRNTKDLTKWLFSFKIDYLPPKKILFKPVFLLLYPYAQFYFTCQINLAMSRGISNWSFAFTLRHSLIFSCHGGKSYSILSQLRNLFQFWWFSFFFFCFFCFLMEFINFLWHFFLLILTTLYLAWAARERARKHNFTQFSCSTWRLFIYLYSFGIDM